MQHLKITARSAPSGGPGKLAILNPYMLTGAEIRRLQSARGEVPCFGTDARYVCQRLDCELARRCMGGLVAYWKR